MNILKALPALGLTIVAVSALLYGLARVVVLWSLYLADMEMRHFDQFTQSMNLSPIAAAFFWFMIGIVITKFALWYLKRIKITG